MSKPSKAEDKTEARSTPSKRLVREDGQIADVLIRVRLIFLPMKNRAFILIELLVIVAILAVLARLLLPALASKVCGTENYLR